jgi:hypothetical protein
MGESSYTALRGERRAGKQSKGPTMGWNVWRREELKRLREGPIA